jgi:hypothetical protein
MRMKTKIAFSGLVGLRHFSGQTNFGVDTGDGRDRCTVRFNNVLCACGESTFIVEKAQTLCIRCRAVIPDWCFEPPIMPDGQAMIMGKGVR